MKKIRACWEIYGNTFNLNDIMSFFFLKKNLREKKLGFEI